ncbi:exopolysaccharide biosynthesis polyprenyl glycosylphosphotransferase [Alcaligenes sp. Me129]
MSAVLAMLFFLFELRVAQIYYRSKLAVLPKGFALNLLGLTEVDARPLSALVLGGIRYDGVVADFGVLSAEEERFLTSCALQGVPVYNAKQIYESITGRVKIDRMSENSIGALLPSPVFERVKQCIDMTLVLLAAPFCILIGLVTAVLIRLESPGPVIYSQLRIGKGNRPFRIYKFRSMRFDIDAPPQFAGENDPRITRVGRIIRKLRIDELPQFANVLKGDMSLIGPRPEQPIFVEEFDRKIPFYSYRHVVKPGITGWAQVRHGYAADADTTQIKIEYDFFYIKHCSFRLDFYIVLLTLRTMLTGFGAR